MTKEMILTIVSFSFVNCDDQSVLVCIFSWYLWLLFCWRDDKDFNVRNIICIILTLVTNFFKPDFYCTYYCVFVFSTLTRGIGRWLRSHKTCLTPPYICTCPKSGASGLFSVVLYVFFLIFIIIYFWIKYIVIYHLTSTHAVSLTQFQFLFSILKWVYYQVKTTKTCFYIIIDLVWNFHVSVET